MAENLTPQLEESPDPFYKALEILNGLSIPRIDQDMIKMTDAEACAKGGQATVTIGTVTAPEKLRTLISDEVLTNLVHANTKISEERVEEAYRSNLAIKKFKWGGTDSEQSAKSFKSFVNELSLIATLSHRNIAPCVGFVEDVRKGVAWIVSVWEPNGNIREFLQSGEWEIPERISLIQDIAAGVEYLHSREPPICHGDLKSGATQLNILVNSSHKALITDFGSARARQFTGVVEDDNVVGISHPAPNHDTAEGLTTPKVKLNGITLELTLTDPGYSLRWTAPEVLDDGVQDLPSDMWALGWICWEIITGKLPFNELDAAGPIICRVLRGELPALRTEAQLSQVVKLCSLMSDCWVGKPVKRIQASTFRRMVYYLVSAPMDYIREFQTSPQ
ncbi:hypothetical protein FRC00_001225 [Tulasnella sp. 408]|nr:hypothetical protein FRC00_001225 [Tulasnella sp. 408]